MRRIAVVFVILVFLPSLALGFLALRSAGEQRLVLERQSAALYQKDVDALAARLSELIFDRQREFAERVRVLLAASSPRQLFGDFAGKLNEPGAAFSITPEAAVVDPAPQRKSEQTYVARNSAFLNNSEIQTVFPVPQQKASAPKQSAAMPQRSDFQTAIAGGGDGVLARYMQDNLELILWTRSPEAGGYVFGLAPPAEVVADLIRAAFPAIAPAVDGACLAVLNERGRPVVRFPPDFRADWKLPFVAADIGEPLPHWRTALFLLKPEQLADSARLVTLTVVLLIGLALAAILVGGTFVALDARRQLALAPQRTDFVSNVSHELKTPLTSIRMFAELLEQKQVKEPEKRSRYLRIISLESERLTRLIDNVLDRLPA